jgi:hypothetical protein
MTGDSPGDSPDTVLDDDALRALLDRPLTELSANELAALKAAFEARESTVTNRIALDIVAPLGIAGVVYSKAFLEALAKHHADALSDAVRTRILKRGKTREVLVGPEDGSAAILIIENQTPDEARLALLDLDVTAEEVRGKTLRWDEKAMVWRADSADD